MTAQQRTSFDRDGYLVIRGALGPDEVAGARQAIDRDPQGAIEVTARPGHALFFDRRIWHARSRNNSRHTSKAVFFGYTYRWTAIRDDPAAMRASDWFGRLAPVQRQLLGGIEAADGDHAWGHYPDRTPLYDWLQGRGLLDPTHPPLRPVG